MKVLVGLILLISMGCTHRPAAPTGLRIVEPEAFDVCHPPRGEEQDEIVQSKGKAFNTAQTECI